MNNKTQSDRSYDPETLNVGDTVTIRDYSWSIGVMDGKLKEYGFAQDRQVEFKILAFTESKRELPQSKSMDRDLSLSPDRYGNDTVLISRENGRVVFINIDYLRKVRLQPDTNEYFEDETVVKEVKKRTTTTVVEEYV